MSQEILLYDLPSKGHCQCWSANVWKTRLVLNYKHIPYKTKFVPYPRLRETLKATGVAPNPQPNWTDYSVPLVRMPDGTHVMDSLKIAPELEKLQPSPPLHLDLGLHQQVAKAAGQAFGPLVPYFMPRVARDVITDEEVEWFHKDREAKLGKPLFELEQERGGDAAWEAAKPGYEAICKLYRENEFKKDQGPFLLGSEPSYGDFIVVAAVQMFKVLGEESFEKIVRQCKEIRVVYEASKEWLQRVD